MNARDSKRLALEALRYMAAKSHSGPIEGAGFAWATLAAIAGVPDLPAPSEVGVGPLKPEYAAIFRPCGAP